MVQTASDDWLRSTIGNPKQIATRELLGVVDVTVELLDASGTQLDSDKTSNTYGADPGMDGVYGMKGTDTALGKDFPDGMYTLRLSAQDQAKYDMFPYETIANGDWGGSGEAYGFTSPEQARELRNGKPYVAGTNTQAVADHWIVAKKAYGFEQRTEVGTFSNDSQVKTYFTVDSTDSNPAIVSDSNGRKLASIDGILAGDTPESYPTIGMVEEPVLSDEEIARGWSFLGWRVYNPHKDAQAPQTIFHGNPSVENRIYTTDEVMKLKVNTDTVLLAAWQLTDYVVTFKTDGEKGQILNNGTPATTQVYTFDGVENKLTTLPTVQAKDGYEFLGWVTDQSENVISEDDIKAINVDSDLNFYAKYRATQHKVTFEAGTGSIGGQAATGIMVRHGEYIPVVPVATPKAGFEFVGWRAADDTTYRDSLTLVAKNPVVADQVYVAEYKALAPVEDGSSKNLQCFAGAAAELLPFLWLVPLALVSQFQVQTHIPGLEPINEYFAQSSAQWNQLVQVHVNDDLGRIILGTGIVSGVLMLGYLYNAKCGANGNPDLKLKDIVSSKR